MLLLNIVNSLYYCKLHSLKWPIASFSVHSTTFHFLSLGLSFSSVGISLAHALAELRNG